MTASADTTAGSDLTARAEAARPSPLPVLRHRLAAYRRVWRGSAFGNFLLPLLFLLAMGVSVGAYVDQAGRLGVPYLDYVAPGLLASAALQLAIGESTWSIMSAFSWTRIYHGMRATPLRPRDMVGGELLFVALRVAISSAAFLLVMTLFGVVHTPAALLDIPVAVLVGIAVCGPCLAYAATIRSDNMFALLFRFGMIPMTLFAGVFFPVDQMPPIVRLLAYVSPLWHGVELTRAATLGWSTAWPAIVHVGYLAVWAIIGYALACWRYDRKLSD